MRKELVNKRSDKTGTEHDDDCLEPSKTIFKLAPMEVILCW